jgi:hypothetical protein
MKYGWRRSCHSKLGGKIRFALEASVQVRPRIVAAHRRTTPCGEKRLRVGEILDQLMEALTAKDEEAVRDRVEELQSWREWLSLDTFDRRDNIFYPTLCA